MRLPRPRLPPLRTPRLGGPAPTIRLRLTVLYGLVFLITGAVLLTIGYALVRAQHRGHCASSASSACGHPVRRRRSIASRAST